MNPIISPYDVGGGAQPPYILSMAVAMASVLRSPRRAPTTWMPSGTPDPFPMPSGHCVTGLPVALNTAVYEKLNVFRTGCKESTFGTEGTFFTRLKIAQPFSPIYLRVNLDFVSPLARGVSPQTTFNYTVPVGGMGQEWSVRDTAERRRPRGESPGIL